MKEGLEALTNDAVVSVFLVGIMGASKILGKEAEKVSLSSTYKEFG